MAEANATPVTPGGAFAAPASAGLAPVAGKVAAVKRKAQQGSLAMDELSARELLAELSEVQAKVQRLIIDASDGLDVQLRFGDNFVGRTIGDRLHAAATGPDQAALTVLKEFAEVIEELSDIVREAARRHTEFDEQAGQDLLGTEARTMPEGGA